MKDLFRGDKLRLARLCNGLTQAELAAKVGVGRQYIQSLEISAKLPSRDLSLALALTLNVAPEFFASDTLTEIKEEHCHFRTRRTTPLSARQQFIARGTAFNLLVSCLESSLDFPRVSFPQLQADSPEELEEAAEQCRRVWKLGEGPITSMCRVVERAGAVVTYFAGVSEKVDALSISTARPIIVQNPAKGSAARMRFDLAHECGHLVLHHGMETGDPETETQANRFASAFLMPRKPFAAEFPRSARMNWKRLYEMKIRWRASVAAIIYRARSLGLLDAAQFYGANVFLSKSGQKKHELYEESIPNEPPEILNAALDAYEKRLGLSLSILANQLNVTPSFLTKLCDVQTILPGNAAPAADSSVVISINRFRVAKE
jgi:Zn-dependent peptidase ImmA (M78 family)/DNA-binding XRE family transcriptional regulator